MFIRAPGPIEVCEHILQVTLAESRDQALSDQTRGSLVDAMREWCIEHKLDKIPLRGRIGCAAYAKCVMAADDLVSIGRSADRRVSAKALAVRARESRTILACHPGDSKLEQYGCGAAVRTWATGEKPLGGEPVLGRDARRLRPQSR